MLRFDHTVPAKGQGATKPRLVTGRTSRKGLLLERMRRFSLCAQTETPPYKYVSVEGPIVAIEDADVERDLRPLAHRYVGPRLGDDYVETTRSEHGDNVLVRVRPDRWRTQLFPSPSRVTPRRSL
jgi:hypothetical protein